MPCCLCLQGLYLLEGRGERHRYLIFLIGTLVFHKCNSTQPGMALEANVTQRKKKCPLNTWLCSDLAIFLFVEEMSWGHCTRPISAFSAACDSRWEESRDTGDGRVTRTAGEAGVKGGRQEKLERRVGHQERDWLARTHTYNHTGTQTISHVCLTLQIQTLKHCVLHKHLRANKCELHPSANRIQVIQLDKEHTLFLSIWSKK